MEESNTKIITLQAQKNKKNKKKTKKQTNKQKNKDKTKKIDQSL